jgi:hypothetical protein
MFTQDKEFSLFFLIVNDRSKTFYGIGTGWSGLKLAPDLGPKASLEKRYPKYPSLEQLNQMRFVFALMSLQKSGLHSPKPPLPSGFHHTG